MSETNSDVIIVAPDSKHGEIRSANIKTEYSKLFLDDVYISLLKQLNSCESEEERKLLEVKVVILSTMVQNSSYWYSVRDFMESFGFDSLKGKEFERWRWFIKAFLYRLYKKGFLERRLIPTLGNPYEYRVRMEKVRNPAIFIYMSIQDLVNAGLI